METVPLGMLAGIVLYSALLAAAGFAICGRSLDSRLDLTARPAPTAMAEPAGAGRFLTKTAAVLLGAAALLLIDFALTDWISDKAFISGPGETNLSAGAGSSDAGAPSRFSHAVCLLAVCAGVIITVRLLRASPLLPALLGAFGCFAISLVFDIAMASEQLTHTRIDDVFTLGSALLVASSMLGLALPGVLQLRHLAIALALYVYALAFRLASVYVVAALWPHLYGATQATVLVFMVMLPISVVAVLCFVGPVALLSPKRAKARRSGGGSTADAGVVADRARSILPSDSPPIG